ncbi:MAG TPA: pyridoxal phosphate-dependent aminotransferase [Epulopiscium sp.]|nr:pyridoxal phosphate-dependent aminotransferase [Candidatus Epulonipiscium sp.]
MKISKIALEITPSSTLAITAKANAMKAEGLDVVGFGAGEPDLDTPDYIKEAAIKAINEGFTKYTPVAGILPLRQAICDKLYKDNNVTYTPAQIVVNNGAKHSLTNTFMAILDPGEEVIIAAPYWLSYPQMVKMAHGVPVIVETQKDNSYKLTPEQFEKAITSKTRAIIINSPSNPTGVVYTKEELEAIGKIAIKHDLYIVSDEIYEYLIYDGAEHVSIASLGKDFYDHTIIINGLSKSYSMTGWRIGYVAAPLNIAKAIDNIQSHATSNPNSIAQKASLAALNGDRTFIDNMRDLFAGRRDYMFERLINIEGFSVVKPQGAFYCFIDVAQLYGKQYNGKAIHSAQDLADVLLEAVNVVVIPCADFGTPECIRLAYAISMEDIKKGLDRIQSCVKSLTN